jgi:hypothetical protein
MNALALTISNTPIRQDAQGRYCLNDLHRAAGNNQKHKPTNFLRLDSTKELIEEINRCSEMRNAVEVRQGGNQQGTFAVKELVYAYAMWISPSFSLQVIHAYDAMMTGQLKATHIDVSKPISLTQYSDYRETLKQAKADLNSATVFLTGAECASLGLHNLLKTAKRRQEEQFKVTDTIIQMELDGCPRHEIVKATGKTFNHVRQVIWQARRDGLLPKGGEE